MSSQLEAKLDDEVFKISQKMLKLEGFGNDIKNLFEKNNLQEKYVNDTIDKLKKEQENFKSQVRQTMDKNNQRI